MKVYNIKFQIYGKKMQTEVRAKNLYQAKEKVLSNLVFDSVTEKTHKEEKKTESKYDFLEDILSMHKGTK